MTKVDKIVISLLPTEFLGMTTRYTSLWILIMVKNSTTGTPIFDSVMIGRTSITSCSNRNKNI